MLFYILVDQFNRLGLGFSSQYRVHSTSIALLQELPMVALTYFEFGTRLTKIRTSKTNIHLASPRQ